MSSQSLVAFIIGSGPNVGQHTAAALKAKGYQVALGSRKPVDKDGYFTVAIDAGKPESIKTAFAEVNKKSGPPSVVIFNATAFIPAPVPEDPLSLPVESFKEQTDISVGLFAAAQEALSGFRSDSLKNQHKTFIATGNSLPWVPVGNPAADPLFLYFGMNIQKTIHLRLLEFLANAYSKEKIRFYFVSLVGATGGMISSHADFANSGPTHAKIYLDFITRDDQADWDYRFTVDGKQWRE
ncbi:hypothetical protein B0H16DRAFT_1768682 [Mycena metata]|uniref:NAD(P)-binding protein n=1 Tax=Mycena metata TaxID=1033252 RepID=A0AAD7I259_9AGAR|nr:hypothetical protein B0H16DRAFT_1768682 [Mycena metata]